MRRNDAKRNLRMASLLGAASVLDLAGRDLDPIGNAAVRRRSARRTDAEALARDAEAIGGDLWTALRREPT